METLKKGWRGLFQNKGIKGRNMVQQANLLAIKPIPGTQKVEERNRHVKNQIDLWMFVKIMLI